MQVKQDRAHALAHIMKKNFDKMKVKTGLAQTEYDDVSQDPISQAVYKELRPKSQLTLDELIEMKLTGQEPTDKNNSQKEITVDL